MRRFPLTAVLMLAALLLAGAAMPDHARAADQTSGIEALSVDGRVGAAVRLALQDTAPAESARTCCKFCYRGKACGDSCIHPEYPCRRPPGCACNAPQ